MDINALADKNKDKILNIIILLVAIFIAFKLYNVQTEKAEQLRQKIETETNKNAVLEEIVGLYDRLNDYKKQFARKDTRIFMNKINTLAKQSGVTITSIKPVSEDAQNDYIRLPFDLNVTAFNYNDLARFIASVESNEDIYRVESAEVVSSESDEKLKANLIISSIIAN